MGGKRSWRRRGRGLFPSNVSVVLLFIFLWLYIYGDEAEVLAQVVKLRNLLRPFCLSIVCRYHGAEITKKTQQKPKSLLRRLVLMEAFKLMKSLLELWCTAGGHVC